MRRRTHRRKVHVAGAAMPCPNDCGYKGNNLEYHFRHSPFCRPETHRPEERKRMRTGSVNVDLFKNKIHGMLSKAMLHALQFFIATTQLVCIC